MCQQPNRLERPNDAASNGIILDFDNVDSIFEYSSKRPFSKRFHSLFQLSNDMYEKSGSIQPINNDIGQKPVLIESDPCTTSLLERFCNYFGFSSGSHKDFGGVQPGVV